MSRNLPSSIYNAVAEYTNMSLDTMSEEDRDYYSKYFNIKFLNATSNQAICFANWQLHPTNLLEAAITINYRLNEDKIPKTSSDEIYEAYVDRLIYYATAIIGRNQLSGIKGCVLSQVSPDLSKDTEATYKEAKSIIAAYEDIEVDRSKVIIKLATTWETMQAAKLLAAENIKTLGTVVHTLEQAILAAEAGCVAISPYVDDLSVNLDPSSYVKFPVEENYGVNLAIKIHKYYKAHGIKTIICVAATIGINSVLALSGVDEITLPVPCLNKILNTPLPDNIKLPALKKTYTVEEAGEKVSYWNDEDGYKAAVAANPIAVDRIEFACSTFSAFGAKSRTLVKHALIEIGFISK